MVPPAWLKTYPSIKPLAAWAIDLVARIQQLAEWVTQGHPVLLWIGGLTFPTGYLTALLQATARKNNQAIDAYSWSFDVLPQPLSHKSVESVVRKVSINARCTCIPFEQAHESDLV